MADEEARGQAQSQQSRGQKKVTLATRWPTDSLKVGSVTYTRDGTEVTEQQAEEARTAAKQRGVRLYDVKEK